MAKARRKERDEAKNIFIREKGKIAPKEIAARLGVTPALVRKWKHEDKWEEILKKPRKGGQPGNKNAAGHGAPEGNQNAVTHGAYITPRMDHLTDEQRAAIEGLSADFDGNALRELQRLEAKRADLEARIAALGKVPEDRDEAKYIDREMQMTLPDGADMKYLSRSSAFSRRMLLEAELNKVDGRIIKLLDSIRSAAAERRRHDLERDRLEFSKQRATGCFNFDENGQLIPDEDDDTEEIID